MLRGIIEPKTRGKWANRNVQAKLLLSDSFNCSNICDKIYFFRFPNPCCLRIKISISFIFRWPTWYALNLAQRHDQTVVDGSELRFQFESPHGPWMVPHYWVQGEDTSQEPKTRCLFLQSRKWSRCYSTRSRYCQEVVDQFWNLLQLHQFAWMEVFIHQC